jgi:hypothetical protein
MAYNEVIQKDSALESNAPGIDPQLMSSMKEEVIRAREENLPKIQAFEAVARKSGLKVNTIRNYYYRYLHAQLDTNEEAAVKRKTVKFGRSIAGKSFTEQEVRTLIMTILQAQAAGESVRGCANRLAKGNAKKMLRFQNKYRNIIASQPEYVESLMEEMSSKGLAYLNPYTKQTVGSVEKSERSAIIKESPKIEEDHTEATAKMPVQQVIQEPLLKALEQVALNLKEFNNLPIHGFFKGLQDLFEMVRETNERKYAGQFIDLENAYKETQDKLKTQELVIEELKEKISKHQAELHFQQSQSARLRYQLNELANINQKFLALSDIDKISGLSDYVKELKIYISTYNEEPQ